MVVHGGWDFVLPFKPYASRWRKCDKFDLRTNCLREQRDFPKMIAVDSTYPSEYRPNGDPITNNPLIEASQPNILSSRSSLPLVPNMECPELSFPLQSDEESDGTDSSESKARGFRGDIQQFSQIKINNHGWLQLTRGSKWHGINVSKEPETNKLPLQVSLVYLKITKVMKKLEVTLKTLHISTIEVVNLLDQADMKTDLSKVEHYHYF